jgi:hypothetical protein
VSLRAPPPLERHKTLQTGEQHIVTAWHISRDGRKQHAAYTISTPEGEVLARSRALWIELKDPTVFGAAATRPGSDSGAQTCLAHLEAPA